MQQKRVKVGEDDGNQEQTGDNPEQTGGNPEQPPDQHVTLQNWNDYKEKYSTQEEIVNLDK